MVKRADAVLRGRGMSAGDIRSFKCAPLALLLAGCLAESNSPAIEFDEFSPIVDPSAAVLHRLTAAQYTNATRDLLGADVIVPSPIEPDASFAGLIALG